ncbi:MAG: hypothetical protein ABIH67_04855 [Candidatus Uhrbacteria bacterium]
MSETEGGREAIIENAKEQVNQALAGLSVAERKKLLASLLQETKKQEVELAEDETEVIEAYFEKQGAGVCSAEVIQQLRSEAEYDGIHPDSFEQAKKKVIQQISYTRDTKFDPDAPNVHYQIEIRQKVRKILEPLLNPEKLLRQKPSPLQNTLRNGLLPIITEQTYYGNSGTTFWAQASEFHQKNIEYNAKLLLYELGAQVGLKAKQPESKSMHGLSRWFDSGQTQYGAELIEQVQDTSALAAKFEKADTRYAEPYIDQNIWQLQIIRILGTHPALRKLMPDTNVDALDHALEKHGIRIVNGFYQRDMVIGEKSERQAKVDLIEAQALVEQLKPLINKLDSIQDDEIRYQSKLKVEAIGERLSEFNALALEYERVSKELDKLNQDYLEIIAVLKETGLFGRMKIRGEERKQADSALVKIQKDMDHIKEKYKFNTLKRQILQYRDLFPSIRSDQDMIDLAADWSANKALMEEMGEIKKKDLAA